MHVCVATSSRHELEVGEAMRLTEHYWVHNTMTNFPEMHPEPMSTSQIGKMTAAGEMRVQGRCHRKGQPQDRHTSTFCEESFNFCDDAGDSSNNGEPAFRNISL